MRFFEEGYKGYYDPAEDRSKIVFGAGSVSSLADEIRVFGNRALLVTSPSIQEHTDLIDKLQAALGSLLVGVFVGSVPHTPRRTVLEAVAYAEPLKPDVIISLGGGSDTDTGKSLRLAMWLGIRERDQFDEAYRIYKGGWEELSAEQLAKPLVPQIGLPTTLISAEHTSGVGITDDEGHGKQVFSHPHLQSKVIMLDPELSTTTPERLWFSTAIKSLEHAVAKLSALERDPVIDAVAAQAVGILGAELVNSQKDPADLVTRGNLLIASWLCMFGSWRTLVTRMGLSHALGRQVGGVSGASHGMISAVLLPICMDFNAPAGGSGLLMQAQALGLDIRGISPEEAARQSAEKVRQIVAALGLPSRLRDIGVNEDDLPLIAEKTMTDMSVPTNPRKIENAEQVLELLKTAW